MKKYFSFIGTMEVVPATQLPENSEQVFTTGGDNSTDVYEAPNGTRYIYEGNDLYRVVERVGYAAVPDAQLNSYAD